MKEAAKADEPSEDKHSYSLLTLVGWLFGALVVYSLSIGPAVWMFEKGYLKKNSPVLERIYAPWVWAYEETLLHKPLGIYLHLWAPKRFDEHGDLH